MSKIGVSTHICQVIVIADLDTLPTALYVELTDRIIPSLGLSCPASVRQWGLAGQPGRFGAATIAVYRQHGVLDARTFPVVTRYARRRLPGPW